MPILCSLRGRGERYGTQRKSGGCYQTEDGESGGQLSTEIVKVPRVGGPGGIKGEVPTKKAVPELWLVFLETRFQLVTRRAKKKRESISPAVSDDSLEAGELRRQMKRNNGCKRIVHSSRDKELFAEDFTKDIVRNGSDSSGAGAVLYMKVIVAVLERSMGMGLLQEGLFSLQDALE